MQDHLSKLIVLEIMIVLAHLEAVIIHGMRSFSCYGIQRFLASPYFLPLPCSVCVSSMWLCCHLCASPLVIVRHCIGRPGLYSRSPHEIQKINEDNFLLSFFAQHTTTAKRLYGKPIDLLEEATTGMADLVLVNSGFTASTFAKTFSCLHSRGVRPAILYPAVNMGQFDGPCAYKLNFLSVNRFERKKNLQLAISAFALLRSLGSTLPDQSLSEATLTIAGGFDKRLKENVEYLEELKELAETEGVSDRVRFVTSCSTAERNALLSECLCVLYTPKDEHFGIVPLEAMAAQKPVIACNSGGPVETIIHETTGFLCDPTPLEFSKHMAKLMATPEMAIKLGKEAHQHVTEKFSIKIFGEQLNRYVLDTFHQRME